MSFLKKLQSLRVDRNENAQIQPGDHITWERSDGKHQGVVDFLHVDSDGARWAFVTIGESWAAVNCKYAARVDTTEISVDLTAHRHAKPSGQQ